VPCTSRWRAAAAAPDEGLPAATCATGKHVSNPALVVKAPYQVGNIQLHQVHGGGTLPRAWHNVRCKQQLLVLQVDDAALDNKERRERRGAPVALHGLFMT
jgi:hypothetical protein